MLFPSPLHLTKTPLSLAPAPHSEGEPKMSIRASAPRDGVLKGSDAFLGPEEIAKFPFKVMLGGPLNYAHCKRAINFSVLFLRYKKANMTESDMELWRMLLSKVKWI
ncbi:hypothetical protein VNO77_26962 [Canavalia gladiata]|uniref:Uncharacterized protein n=1 Tax=Canavalia gladiata TaxID=3824 RepID=A0AAN9KWC4_CANGL